MAYNNKPKHNKPTQNSNKTHTHWGEVANWYDGMINDKDSYQNQVILPTIIKSLNIKPNETVLDLGCGVGFFCQKYFDQKAKVIGIDLGAESIRIAKEKTSKDILYYTDTAEKISFIQDNSVDKITIILAIQNIKKANQCISECSRVLKSNGELIIVINHPYFRIPKSTAWVWSDQEFTQYRRVDRYLSPFEVDIDMEPSKKNSNTQTVSFHRPLEWYIQIAAKNRLLLHDMQELISHRKTDQGPKKTPKLELCRQEIPLFMLLKWVKV